MYIKNEPSHVGNIMFALFVVKSPLGAAVPALLGYVTLNNHSFVGAPNPNHPTDENN